MPHLAAAWSRRWDSPLIPNDLLFAQGVADLGEHGQPMVERCFTLLSSPEKVVCRPGLHYSTRSALGEAVAAAGTMSQIQAGAPIAVASIIRSAQLPQAAIAGFAMGRHLEPRFRQQPSVRRQLMRSLASTVTLGDAPWTPAEHVMGSMLFGAGDDGAQARRWAHAIVRGHVPSVEAVAHESLGSPAWMQDCDRPKLLQWGQSLITHGNANVIMTDPLLMSGFAAMAISGRGSAEPHAPLSADHHDQACRIFSALAASSGS